MNNPVHRKNVELKYICNECEYTMNDGHPLRNHIGKNHYHNVNKSLECEFEVSSTHSKWHHMHRKHVHSRLNFKDYEYKDGIKSCDMEHVVSVFINKIHWR